MATIDPSSAELNPQPLPPREVRVHVTRDVLYNAESMKTVVNKVLGKLGCPTCHSGFDFRFIEQSDFVVDSALEVHPQPKFR